MILLLANGLCSSKAVRLKELFESIGINKPLIQTANIYPNTSEVMEFQAVSTTIQRFSKQYHNRSPFPSNIRWQLLLLMHVDIQGGGLLVIHV